MVETSTLLPVADTLKLFGNNGTLVVKFRTDARKFFKETEPVFALMDGIPVPFFIATFEPRGNDRAHILFDHIYREAQALELIGKTLYQSASKKHENKKRTLQRFEDPALLVGFTVSDVQHGALGHVTEFIDWRLNPCLNIKLAHSDKTFLVPFQEALIKGIDLKNRHITMSIPEGLVEI